jgi:hypothetical protein
MASRERRPAFVTIPGQNFCAPKAMLNPFPRDVTSQVLHRSFCFLDTLRHEDSSNLNHQSLRVIRRFEICPVEHQYQEPQGPYRITVCFVQ